MTSRRLVFVLVFLAVVSTFVIVQWVLPPGGKQGPLLAEQQVHSRPIVWPANGYVGSSTCQECHAAEHQSWHLSYHRTMTQAITRETAPAAVTNTRVEIEGETYVFTNDGDDFTVELNDPNLHGKRVKRPLVMMTGSHHMHVFWYGSDFERTPAQLPIVYLIAEARWIPRRSAFLRPPEMSKGTELGRWNQTCSICHSTNPRQRLDRETHTWDTHVSEFGISCEECHGPAEAHVQFRRERPNSTEPDPIVNPRHLAAKVRSDVCGQCHGISIRDLSKQSEEKFMTLGCEFLPGDSLGGEKSLEIVRAGPDDRTSHAFKFWDAERDQLENSFWLDGEVRVSGREYNGLIESPCYQRGELGCISCHQLHERDQEKQEAWRDDQLRHGMRGAAACVQCHDDSDKYGPSHTHHMLSSSGNDCLNCHMPHTVYGLLKTIRSHRISSPSVAVSLETGRANACNLCHLDQSLQWTAEHLNEWYGHPIPEIDPVQRETAASVFQLLKGDAAQRAIQLSAMNWPPAKEVSGTDWMPPYLLIGLGDPYDAVRLISFKTLITIPGWEDFLCDPVGPAEVRGSIVGQKMGELETSMKRSPNPLLLFTPEGRFDTPRAVQLLQDRNHRDMYLKE